MWKSTWRAVDYLDVRQVYALVESAAKGDYLLARWSMSDERPEDRSQDLKLETYCLSSHKSGTSARLEDWKPFRDLQNRAQMTQHIQYCRVSRLFNIPES